MTAPWLHIIGIGEDGLDGLSRSAATLVRSAEVIVGGERHHGLSSEVSAERVSWPTPFDTLVPTLQSHKGRRVVVLVSGDPLWYSAGNKIGRKIGFDEVTYHPHVSAFQLAASRMGWPMDQVQTLTAHGRDPEKIIPFIAPGAKLLVLSKDRNTPADIARILNEKGFAASRLTVLAHMGGPAEQSFEGTAADWAQDVPDFQTVAIECFAVPDAQIHLRVPGLPDDAFQHDGNITKQEVRAITLAKLGPTLGAVLWDIGLGCGSVSIEWMRAARNAQAIGIEPRADRRALAAANALALGVPGLDIVEGSAPDALKGLEPPDAVFIGGGLSEAVFDLSWASLKPHGRLVANTVTLESERVLLDLSARHGGDLVRLSVDRATEVGSMRGWKPLMPVIQWSIRK